MYRSRQRRKRYRSHVANSSQQMHFCRIWRIYTLDQTYLLPSPLQDYSIHVWTKFLRYIQLILLGAKRQIKCLLPLWGYIQDVCFFLYILILSFFQRQHQYHNKYNKLFLGHRLLNLVRRYCRCRISLHPSIIQPIVLLAVHIVPQGQLPPLLLE